MYNVLRQGIAKYTVKEHDTLLNIANKYPHTSIDAIILRNKLVVLIYPGQELFVGHFKPLYRVKKGEHVYKIAMDNATTMEQIILDNNLVVLIYPGQTLFIPLT